ncbi:MAG: hypothetical protein JRI30_00410 [Deltaproteobacteria bacterium]|nr:hypothetical protein [Deltaproteobacteria bacterium]
MNEAHQRGKIILSGGRVGKYQDKANRGAITFGKKSDLPLDYYKRC